MHIVLAVVLLIGYFGMGYAIYDELGNVTGSCDRHEANRPDNFALHGDWPSGFAVTPYYMSPYEPVRFPSCEAGFEVAGWWIPAKQADPAAPAVIVPDGLSGCKNSISALMPAGMLWRNGFNVSARVPETAGRVLPRELAGMSCLLHSTGSMKRSRTLTPRSGATILRLPWNRRAPTTSPSTSVQPGCRKSVAETR